MGDTGAGKRVSAAESLLAACHSARSSEHRRENTCYEVLPLLYGSPKPIGAMILPVLNHRMCFLELVDKTITSHLNSSSSVLRSNSSTAC